MTSERTQTGYSSIDKPWEIFDQYVGYSKYDPEFAKQPCWKMAYDKNVTEPDAIAIDFYGRQITNKELWSNVKRAGQAFQKLGIQKNDLVFMLCVNMPEVLYCMYALNRIGAVTEWFNPLAISPELLKKYITESNVRYIVAVDLMYEVISKAIQGTGVQTVVCLSVQDSFPLKLRCAYNVQVRGTHFLQKIIPNSTKIAEYATKEKIQQKASYYVSKKRDSRIVRWKEFLKTYHSDAPILDVPYEHGRITFIVHTGGTTGPVKRVAHTDYAINSVVYQLSISKVKFYDKMTALHVLPPIVAFALEDYHLERYYNMKSCIVSTYDKNEYVKFIKQYKPNLLACVPSFLGEIRDENLSKDDRLDYLDTIIHGGEAFPIPLDREVDQVLKSRGCHAKTQMGYGQNEEFGGFTLNLDIPGVQKEYGSCGIPLAGNSCVIYDLNSQKELPYGLDSSGNPYIGELLVAGPTVMKGYIGDDAKENATTFIQINGITYVDTGDQAYIDEKGRLWYVTRNKRIVRTQDGKIFTNVIESLLAQMNEVFECCVVAIPHPKMVKAASCHIVLRKAYSADDVSRKQAIANIISHIEEETGKMYSYYVPNTYEFRKEPLPRTPFGKIDFLKLEQENSALYDNYNGNVPKIRNTYN